MNLRQSALAVLCAAALLLTGCRTRTEGGQTPDSAQEPSAAGSSEPAPGAVAPGAEASGAVEETGDAAASAGRDYIDEVVQEVVARFLEPDMDEFERTKAAFDYLLANYHLVEPVGLDLWRIRGGDGELPSYVENRSLSVLLFHLGMCEDYAAALTVLLRGAGLEAEYVPGLTYSVEGVLVDHAWTAVRVDGVWYHLDPQLEANVSRHGSINYRYFMKGDATLSGSHRWGENLIRSGLLSDEQNEEIARNHLLESCPQDYPTPQRQPFTASAMPDVAAIEAGIAAEIVAYEDEHGPLAPRELNVVPPVFGYDGYPVS